MLKRSGAILVIVLVAVAAVVLFSGALKQVFPASQSSPLAQKYVEPNREVRTFPITTLGALENQNQRLEVIKATAGIVSEEYESKIGLSRGAYDKLVGTTGQPGYLGAILFSVLAGYGVKIYDKNTMYSETEVKEIKNGQ